MSVQTAKKVFTFLHKQQQRMGHEVCDGSEFLNEEERVEVLTITFHIFFHVENNVKYLKSAGLVRFKTCP